MSRREDPTEIYDKTFNQGYPLRPRGTYDVYKGGMVKANRKMIGDIDILGGTTNPTKNKKQIQTCLPFMVAVVDSEPQKTYTLDFTKVGKIKPFTFENR